MPAADLEASKTRCRIKHSPSAAWRGGGGKRENHCPSVSAAFTTRALIYHALFMSRRLDKVSPPTPPPRSVERARGHRRQRASAALFGLDGVCVCASTYNIESIHNGYSVTSVETVVLVQGRPSSQLTGHARTITMIAENSNILLHNSKASIFLLVEQER